MPTNQDPEDNSQPGAAIIEVIKQQLLLSKRIQRAGFTSNTIHDIERYIDDISNLFAQHFHPTIAQLHLLKPSIGYFHNLVFNSLIIALLLCRRNHWNATTTQQLLCGLFSWLLCYQAHIEKLFGKSNQQMEPTEQQKTLFAKLNVFLVNHQREVWSAAMKAADKQALLTQMSHLANPNYRCKTSLYVCIALNLGFSCTRNERTKVLPFAHAVKRLSEKLHMSGLPVLDSLVVYPGPILAGNHIKSSTEDTYFVLSTEQDKLLARKYEKQRKNYSPVISELANEDIQQILPAISLKHLGMMDEVWDEEWQEQSESLLVERFLNIHSYRLDKPPASLVSIIEHMEQQDIEVEALCELISQEPGFVEHLQLTASQSARQRIPISDLKHSLLMNGFERTRSALVQKALISRLNQHYFPLQDSFYQFLKFWSHISASLAEHHPRLISEQVSNWTYFSCSGLFTCAELKYQNSWHVKKQATEQLMDLVALKHPEQLLTHAQKLSESWVQGRELLTALRLMSADKTVKNSVEKTKVAEKSLAMSIISLSFIIAHRFYIFGELPETIGEEYRQALGLSDELTMDCIDSSLQKTHLFSPINSQIVHVT